MLYRPTDLEFAPDGSIIICGWGGDYHYDRGSEGSWMYRITHTGRPALSKSDWFPEKRSRPYAQWNVEQLVEDLGSDVLPVWRVNAQDELVRRGRKVRDALIQAWSEAPYTGSIPAENPYGDGHAGERIAAIMVESLLK